MKPADLAAWQARLGFSQVEAAERLKMPVQTYRNILKGRRHAEGLPDAIALLCQFIEESSRGAGPVVTPHLVFSVSADEIRALDQSLLVELLRQLLHVEAESAGILRSGIHVPAQINVADGGEDGRIEWFEGPDHTRFLPCRLVQFQVKATDMPPAKCAGEMREKDGSVKERILSTIKAGGTYVIFCNRPCTQAMIDERIARMRQVLNNEEAGLASVARLDFWDANRIADWANSHYPVALWVIERIRSGGILPFQTLERWGNDKKVAEFKFVDDPRVELVSSQVERSLSSPRGVLRLAGLSGLGKTRLAFEVLRKAPISFRARVLYTHGGFGAERILGVVQAIREFGKSAIIVVDDCPTDMHKTLATIVEHANSQLRLLTIDYDPAPPSPEYASITIPRAADKVVIDIIRQVAHSVSDSDANRLAQFAQGFPQIAVLIARAWPFDTYDISSLTGDDLIKKMVFGRDAPNPELFSVTQALSLYDTVGVEEEAMGELRFVASTADIDPDAAYSHVQTLIDRGIVQKRGRFVQVQPKPLALALAAAAWKRMTPSKTDRLAIDPMPGRLKGALFGQFARLDGVEKARQIAEDLCVLGRPFAQSTFLDDELHAECLAMIAEVNPAAAVSALEHAFADMSADELRRIQAGRRRLVWTLEKLCFLEETFQRASKLLLDFAVAENEEEIGNNATGLFRSLFKVYLSGTETPAIKRLKVIDDALASGNPERRRIAFAALEEGLEAWHFTRFGGSERQGSRPSLKDWAPSTRAELIEYYRACLERLVDVACSEDDLSVAAKEHLAGRIRGLIGLGLVDDIATMADRVLASDDPYWPQAIEQTAMSLNFEGPGMPPEYRRKVEALHQKLSPRSLEHRLRLYVCELPWGYYEEGTNVLESGERWAKTLANECVERWGEFLTLLPMLLKGEQRHSFALGRHIMEAVDDAEKVIDLMLSSLQKIPKRERNAALLGGMLASAEKRDPSMIDRKLDAVALDPDMIHLLPWLTMQTTIELSDLERIAVALRGGKSLPIEVRVLSMGGALYHLAPPAVAHLFDALIDSGTEGCWTAIEILGMYLHQNPDAHDDFRPQFRRLMTGIDVTTRGDGPPAMDTHFFCGIASWLMRHGSTDEDARLAATMLTVQAAKYCVDESVRHGGRDVFKKLLPDIFGHCWSEAWPILSAMMEAHQDRIWRYERLLKIQDLNGKTLASPIFLVPWELLRAWCHKNSGFAPAFLMRIAPKFEEGTSLSGGPGAYNANAEASQQPRTPQWSQVVLRLLDDFGDRKDVLDALSGNMMTFMWCGSLVPYFERYSAPLRMLLEHHRPPVAAWARRQLDAQKQAVRHEQHRDDEREFGIF